MTLGYGAEFDFELRVCQWAERAWPPEADRKRPILVARQLGTKRRRWDTIVIECDPDGLRQRAHFGERALDSDLLDVVPHAPAEWTYYREALPDPGYPWRYVREAIHRAADRDILDTRKREGRIEIRRQAVYPDWVDRIVAIENKPDLDASAARDLAPQLQRDVAMGLADEVWVGTAATGQRVEPALLEDFPVEAGVLVVDPVAGDADVAWHPRSLDPQSPGTRILDRPDGGERDASAARFEYVDPDWNGQKRVEIAERAYERGWRAYVETMRPDCRYFDLDWIQSGPIPVCQAKERPQTSAECRGACSAFEPEPPAWRTADWPLSGGPGTAIQRVLDRRRRRHRPGLE
ncbi:hypothetical protein Hrd1104_08035 [Halorhabdus sp. CBA1104]|uniref:DUF5787 family protein n=1 Tax=unclassified Halorhabdus TaxID=2621901 RepID=UPI0012B18E8F|nr:MULTISPECIES: DUF5787 family protein [unclassified Halorhabdus]QGN07256.1 hypothetical protein Hrd1104_08035 [Halorhabdus sp. CBA1104]